jgi:biotin carboxyl carrier protein
VIATLKNPDGTVERIRFSFQQVKNQIWAKLPQSSVTNALDFYGERSSVSRSSAQQDSASDFTAQFPGKVRKILAKEGQVVDADMPLLMIEAMKMEFPIKSSEPGIVQKILVQVLTPGQKLLLFEVTPKEGKK